MSESIIVVGEPRAPPIWPLLTAPIGAIVYYGALKLAFTMSLNSAVGEQEVNGSYTALADIHWGSHWLYRIVAEVFSIGIATFVASGLAHGREKTAAITAGSTISLFFLTPVIWLLWLVIGPPNLNLSEIVLNEPWYQFAIGMVLIITSPIIGIFVSHMAEETNRDSTVGLGGINRLHFIWLWVAAFCYALGLISPVVRYYVRTFDFGPSSIVGVIALAVPAGVMIVPAHYGLGLLSRHLGTRLNPIARNILGVFVIVSGFLVGAMIQFGWYLLLHWVSGK